MNNIALKTVCDLDLISKGDSVIAAVSGGYDSLCMLNVLCALKRLRKFEVCAVHINHKLRDEADADEEFVKSEAQRLGIECHSKALMFRDMPKKTEFLLKLQAGKYATTILQRLPACIQIP